MLKIKIKDTSKDIVVTAKCDNADELAKFFAKHTTYEDLIYFRNALSKVISRQEGKK